MTKKTRIRRSPEEKRAICRATLEGLRAGETFANAAQKQGAHEALVRQWLDRYGAEMGWTGSTADFTGRTHSTGRHAIGSRPPDADWLARNQTQLGLALPGEPEPESSDDGDTLLSRPEPPASEMTGAIVRRVPSRRRRERDVEDEPLYRAEPVRVEEPPPSPPVSSAPLIENELLRQALREKDAVLTTLEILIREGRIKIPH